MLEIKNAVVNPTHHIGLTLNFLLQENHPSLRVMTKVSPTPVLNRTKFN